MRNAEEFDEFYVASRRRILLQTFALTGDIGAAKHAVRDAFVASRHHWNKVGRMEEPEDWVRPRAWAVAQRRHTARLWHKEKGLTDAQAEVLEALQKLPDVERKTLLLTHLAHLSMAEIGREIGETRERAEVHLQHATTTAALHLDIDSTGIRGRLDELASAISRVKLPRAPIIRRGGRARRRNHAVVGSAVLVMVTVLAGAFVVQGAPAPPTAGPPAGKQAVPVSRAMLMQLPGVRVLAPKQTWQQLRTTDNTEGSGINSRCQGSRFADEAGLGTLVRKFQSSGKPAHKLIETVEISASPGAARAAYQTTLGWFAGCSIARLQLLGAYRIKGIGNQAQLLRLRVPGKDGRSYLVAVTRSGALTISALVETRGGRSPEARLLVRSLASGVRRLCDADAADACVSSPTAAPVLPPPSGETPGMLAIGDLPAIGKINRPWVGTDPLRGRARIAATTCDRSDFVKSGAPRPLSRSFLIPQAKLPKRFGITETVGEFRSNRMAKRFVSQVKRRMAACPDEQLASTVTREVLVDDAWRNTQFHLWRLENQVNENDDKVGFWMGVAQVGNFVAQVNFTPVAGNDVDEQTFRALIARARDRLFEVKK